MIWEGFGNDLGAIWESSGMHLVGLGVIWEGGEWFGIDLGVISDSGLVWLLGLWVVCVLSWGCVVVTAGFV